jgi:hypothetical protein
MLARWCDVHIRALRPFLNDLATQGTIERHGALYGHPLSPAGRIQIRGYRW